MLLIFVSSLYNKALKIMSVSSGNSFASITCILFTWEIDLFPYNITMPMVIIGENNFLDKSRKMPIVYFPLSILQ